jgi:hypothetical protein
MRANTAALLGAALSLFLVAATFADVRREVPARRPYITEIGEPYAIDKARLKREAARIDALAESLAELGDPDYAEIQEIRPEWPWDSYEVRIYYLRPNLELDFGRARTLDAAYPNLGIVKFQGGIPVSKRVEIESRLAPAAEPAPPPAQPAEAVPAPPAVSEPRRPSLEELAARVEAAAERAAIAAEQAVERSQAAERAAERTTNVVDRLLQETERSR